MNARKIMMIATALASAAPALAAGPEQDREELRAMCNESLTMLEKLDPAARARAAKAAGYGCFVNFGLTMLFGGAGGKGLVHDNAANRDTYMNVAQVAIGPELSVKKYREVLIFNNPEILHQFVTGGWELMGSGGAVAKLEAKGGEVGAAGSMRDGIEVYPVTSTGLGFGGVANGRKYWRSASLN